MAGPAPATAIHLTSWELVDPGVGGPEWWGEWGKKGSDSSPAAVGHGFDGKDHLNVVPGDDGTINRMSCPDPMQ